MIKTSNFLEKSLNEDEIKILEDHLSFSSMKSNPAVNYEDVVVMNKKFKLIEVDGHFMRSGKVNQWKEKMPSDMITLFDDWTQINLKDTSLFF